MAIEKYSDGTVAISGDRDTHLFDLLRKRVMLKLELKGMKNSRGSMFAAVKREFGLKGNKASVFNQFNAIVEEAGRMRNLAVQEENAQIVAGVDAALAPNPN